MRTCKKCGSEKPLDDFPKYRGTDDVIRWRHTCRTCFNTGVMKWQEDNPHAKHRSYVLRNYGLSWEEYQTLMSKGCAVCGTMERLTVDHDHACCPTKTKTCGDCIRGVLCNRHNIAEGLLQGNPQEAYALAEYMQNWLDQTKEVD